MADETIHRREPAWSPGQAVALVVGILFVVLGGVALARAGLGELTSPHVSVGGFHHTPLLALIEIAYGILLLGAASVPGGDRFGLVFLGALALAFGLVLAIAPEGFHDALGAHPNTGWLYVLTGVVALLGALLIPAIPGTVADGTSVALLVGFGVAILFLILVLFLLAAERPPGEVTIELPDEVTIPLPPGAGD